VIGLAGEKINLAEVSLPVGRNPEGVVSAVVNHQPVHANQKGFTGVRRGQRRYLDVSDAPGFPRLQMHILLLRHRRLPAEHVGNPRDDLLPFPDGLVVVIAVAMGHKDDHVQILEFPRIDESVCQGWGSRRVAVQVVVEDKKVGSGFDCERVVADVPDHRLFLLHLLLEHGRCVV
jgi:hypothetical protein